VLEEDGLAASPASCSFPERGSVGNDEERARLEALLDVDAAEAAAEAEAERMDLTNSSSMTRLYTRCTLMNKWWAMKYEMKALKALGACAVIAARFASCCACAFVTALEVLEVPVDDIEGR